MSSMMRPQKTAAILSLILLLYAFGTVPSDFAWAGVYSVQPDGLGDYPTIQDAIDSSAPGDTIRLTSGTFQGTGNRDLSFAGKAILLESASASPDSSIIDCESLTRAISFASGDTSVVVRGISFLNGSVTGSDVGGALSIGAGASPSFENCVLAANVSQAEGGAVHVSGASPSFTNCVLAGNVAVDGGAFFIADSSVVTILGCTLADNQASSRGGAVYAAGDSLQSFERSVLWGNCASVEGGSAFVAANGSIDFACSDVDSSLVEGTGVTNYDLDTIFDDPLFCSAVGCVGASSAGTYTVYDTSPVLPSASPCGLLIGARSVGCATPTGACCATDGSCTVETSADCGTAGGTYQGDATVCDPNPCPQPTGACCASDGSCTIETSADCGTAGGTYQGDATVCDPNPCPQPTGACCASDGSCTIETSADCGTAGGTYQGDATVCDPNPCPQPIGACCASDGTCSIAEIGPCGTGGGVFQGDGTVCSPNPCPAFVVSPDGLGDYATIQDAIDGVAPTANIELTSGVFTGLGNQDLVFGGKALTLRSASGDPDSTVIDCQSSGRGFYFKDGEDSTTVVRGVGIINGSVTDGGRGGGIAMVYSSPRLIDCAVRGSTSELNGGGVYLLDASPRLESCLFAGNAASQGGGLFVEGSSVPRLSGCTIADNFAAAYGGGIYTSSSDSLHFERSILYGNCADMGGAEARIDAFGAVFATSCSLADSSGVDGDGVVMWSAEDIFVNPRFCSPVDCGIAPTTTGVYSVRAGAPVLAEESPCGLQIGFRGEGCASFPTGACCQAEGGCVIREEVICGEEGGIYQGDGSVCDPDPCPASGACCLDDGSCLVRIPALCTGLGGTYLGDGTVCSPEGCALVVLADGSGAYPTIQSAVDAAASGSIVELANGVFTGVGNRGVQFGGKAITVRSASGVPDSCVVDAEGLDRGFYFRDGETQASVLEGISIRNGAVTGGGRGGGIACVLGSSPTIRNVAIRGCTSEAEGGAFYASSGSPLLEECLVSGNAATEGAGVFIEGTASAYLVGCTVSGNSATLSGGGVRAGGVGAVLERTIVWGNCAPQGPEVYLAISGLAADFFCSSVDSTGVTGTGTASYDEHTLFADPLFCDFDSCGAAPAITGDYTLSSFSPCLATVSPCSLLIGARGEGCGPIATGACCLPDGACAIQSETICTNAGGTYQGDEVPCDPSPCTSVGACCLPDGSCDLFVEFACTSLGGTFRGAGTTCDADSCAAFVVLPDGSGDFATIQDAIDFVGPGATIELGNGDFTGTGNKDLRFYGKPLRLRSASGDPDSCRIDCEGVGRGFYFRDGEGPETIVEAVGVVGGALTGSGRGAGIALVGASPTLRRVLVSGCVSEANGGGVYASGGTPTLESCTIARNRAYQGGGIFVEGDADVTLIKTIVHGNCATIDTEFGNSDDEAVAGSETSALRFQCAAVDSAGVSGSGTIEYDGNTVFASPIFCGAVPCGDAPTSGGLYSIDISSPCSAANSPCGELIGAIGVACADSVGACCLDDLCFVTNATTCADEFGEYQGNGTECDPNPCPEPGACCLPDDTCLQLTRTTCYANSGIFLGEGVPCSPDGCSFNAGGALIVHANEAIQYEFGSAYCDSSGIVACGDGINSVASADTLVFHVIAALPDDGGSRLTGVTFGIDYDPTLISILDSGPCGDFELAEPAWPDSGSGTAVTWTVPQLETMVDVYWFAIEIAGGGPARFSLRPHPTQGAFFSDDQVPPTLDQIACLGTLGIGMSGSDCCATVDIVPGLPIPTELRLRSVQPNPVSDEATVLFDLPESGRVDLAVFDASGRRVAQLLHGEEAAGTHRVVWSALNDLHGGATRPNGVYFVRLYALGETLVRKFVVLE
ncbi:MAG: right-handed parallel beta-helix repeat-containing protein [Candidatus Eisenbacteria bacterium]|uniref:Right-handed parallel beta-helix repeat-containing protein n=1 Tax=Eiseniibacteriota bacterium TaxID=2212470 RepID=A0A956SCM7_UNCEI|nr:right-handed parallel beta-helix repeat-containing protein [Candidatus Eisenbacteria bacterium]